MSEGFSSPIVGGGGALVYPAIHSPNYVLAVTGWAIRKDGTAQFTGLVLIGGTFTGTTFIINNSGSFFYSGAPALGNLIATIASAGGTDSKGNIYFGGVCAYQASGGASATSIAQLLNGALNVGRPVQLAGTGGARSATVGLDSLSDIGVLQLDSGLASSVDISASLYLVSEAAAALGPNGAVLESSGPILLDTFSTPPASGRGPKMWGEAVTEHVQARSGTTASGGDANVYDVERLTLRTAATTFSSTGFVTVPGLTKPVGKGTYRFRAHLMYVGNGTGTVGNPVFKVTGPASAGSLNFIGLGGAGVPVVRFDNASGFGSALTGAQLPAGDSTTRFDVVIEGSAVFSAAGTLAVLAAISGAGTAQFVIATGSTFDIEPVVAT